MLKFSGQVNLVSHLNDPVHVWQNVHALQYPLHFKHPVQRAQPPGQPLLQLPVQLPLQLVQLDAHLKVNKKEKIWQLQLAQFYQF